LPLTIMLFLAIGLRTSEYGITANRYITWLMGIWLVLICCYFVFRGKDLRAVPISLFLFTLLSSFGPWGMFSVSEKSQINRLEEILTKNGILVNGKITNEPMWDSSDPANTLFFVENGRLNEGKISHSDHNEVESILNYLQDFHGITGIDEWYAQNPMEIAAQTKAGEANVYMQLMGLNYIHYYDDEGYRYVSFYNNNNSTPIRNVSGFDYSMTLNHSQGSGLNENTVSTPNGTLVLATTDSIISITLQQGEAQDQHSIQINGLFETLQKKYPGESGGSVSSEEMTVVYENEWLRMRLTLNSVTGEVKESDSEMTGYDGELLVGLKERP